MAALNSSDGASHTTNHDVPPPPHDLSGSDSHIWNFPLSIQPGHLFFASAISLCAGAYVGFSRQIKIYQKEAAAEAAAEAMNAVNTVVTTEGRILAARALTIATMSSVGAFSLVGAGKFDACLFQSKHGVAQYLTYFPSPSFILQLWIPIHGRSFSVIQKLGTTNEN